MKTVGQVWCFHRPVDFVQGNIHDATKTWAIPNCVQKIQLAKQSSLSPKLNVDNTNYVQSINGNFIDYAHTIDPTMFSALNKTPNCQSAPTQDTLTKSNQVLYYAKTSSRDNPIPCQWHNINDWYRCRLTCLILCLQSHRYQSLILCHWHGIGLSREDVFA